jgi:hypothetical protein
MASLVLYLVVLFAVRLPGVNIEAKMLAPVVAATIHVGLVFGLPRLARIR